MKKSNIFLISAVCLAICWTILIGWFAASAINNYRQGKDPYYARSHQQILESRKKSFPLPSRELYISGDSTLTLTILPGKELSVLCYQRIWDCIYTDLKTGRSIIRFKKLKGENYNDPVTIILSGIPVLSLDNFYNVTL